MKSEIEMKMKKKPAKKKRRWIAAVAIVGVLVIGGLTGYSLIVREHVEARNITLNAVDFSRLRDGTYIGDYEGGMYKWRTNEVQVTVASGKVAGIKLLSTIDPAKDNVQQDMLYEEVIKAQSLQVDTISGATLTSKAYLKAVENALLKAQI